MPTRAFVAWPGSIPAARDYVLAALDQLPVDLRETAAVLTSELVTNAVRHGGGPDFEVSVQYLSGEDRLRVGVTDTGAGNPLAGRPPVTSESGRGLQLVGLLAARWGVRRRRDDVAKTVWFELDGDAARPVSEEPAHLEADPSS
jgi:anti-sigma regulatory factor (Ser/Thr protein kinase)